MKKLSKEAENKLMGAIEKTAAFVNDGLDPNQAIAKAAAEDGIPPGNINLMVHAYNTGRTTRQREEGADALEKSADFPLADAATVLELLYPAQVKTAAAVKQSTVVSTEYALSPTGLLGRRLAAEKAAACKVAAPAPPTPYPSDPLAAMRRAYSTAQRHGYAADEARRKMSAAFDKMGQTFMEITDYFRSPASTPLPVVREQAMLLHGGKARDLLDEIVKVTPALAKFSHHKRAVFTNQPHQADGEVYGLISQFLDELDTYKQLKTAFAEVAKTAAAASEEALRPFVQAPRSVLEEESSTEKRGNMGMLYGASAVKNLLSDIDTTGQAAPSGAIYDKISDPDHEAELRNIQTGAMLQDLLLNDPVISGYDPQDALNAYNDIVAVSPRAATHRMLAESLMRKRLEQGAMDSFDVDQLLGMEEKQRKITTPGKGVGDGSVLG